MLKAAKHKGDQCGRVKPWPGRGEPVLHRCVLSKYHQGNHTCECLLAATRVGKVHHPVQGEWSNDWE